MFCCFCLFFKRPCDSVLLLAIKRYTPIVNIASKLIASKLRSHMSLTTLCCVATGINFKRFTEKNRSPVESNLNKGPAGLVKCYCLSDT